VIALSAQHRPHTRRSFVTALGAALAAAPFVKTRAKTDPLDGAIIGHGDFRYRVMKNWCRADPKRHPVKDCHEMVELADGHLALLTNHKANNLLVLSPDGAVADSWTFDFSGAHGLSLARDAAGRECLLITDTSSGRVVRASLAGEILQEFPHPAKAGAYSERDDYRPTESAMAPNGDVYVADGYGSQWILQFSADGAFIRKFGGKSTQPVNQGKFMQAHGVAIDTRGPEPLVVCTARIRNEFHWFKLDGAFDHSVYLPGAYVSRPVIAGENLFSGVCFGTFENDFRMWQGRGFVTILDKADQNISNPGGSEPRYQDGKLAQIMQAEPVFNNCHDVCVDSRGDLFVCQWNSGAVYPYKLERV
jgi:peptidylamidoglycolate lyase